MCRTYRFLALLLLGLAVFRHASAETGAEAWLRYSSVKPAASSLPGLVAAVGKGEMVRTAGRELVRALAGKPANQGPVGALPNANAFVLGHWKDIHPLF